MLIAVVAIALQACNGNDDKPETKVTKKAVIENYANIVYTNYNESLIAAKAMQTKIEAFIANPTEKTMQEAKKAWLEAREPYGESEVFRGSNGPIDSESKEEWAINNEGQINAWPLNEAYIDYVKTKTDWTGDGGIYKQSIIGNTSVEITKEKLASLNEMGGDEAAVSTGWHAIEFLLWGQDENKPAKFTDKDLSKNKSAGMRPVEDYTTKPNADRRKTYLKVVTELLIDDLTDLVNTWAPKGMYRSVFMSLKEDVALKNIIEGPQFLAAAELSNERMLVPAYGTNGFDGSGQEDEHSCFSDNTHRDVYLNAKGIVNVLKGEYGSIKGASIIDLVKAKDKKQGAKLEKATNDMWAAIKKINDKAQKEGVPFDMMILSEGKNGEGVVLKAEALLKELGGVIRESAAKLGITTATDESYENTPI